MKLGTRGILILLGGLLLVAVGIVFFAWSFGPGYYVNASELSASPDTYSGASVRAAGVVADESIIPMDGGVEFSLLAGQKQLLVTYSSATPPGFGEGRPVVVEGVFDAGSFSIKAEKVVTKCPSKYEAEKVQQ